MESEQPRQRHRSKLLLSQQTVPQGGSQPAPSLPSPSCSAPTPKATQHRSWKSSQGASRT
eukprot:2881515-Amphidinium_carterae.1